jgi:hypothetical protein
MPGSDRASPLFVTIPIELLPAWPKKWVEFDPFKYHIQPMRICIGGFYLVDEMRF